MACVYCEIYWSCSLIHVFHYIILISLQNSSTCVDPGGQGRDTRALKNCKYRFPEEKAIGPPTGKKLDSAPTPVFHLSCRYSWSGCDIYSAIGTASAHSVANQTLDAHRGSTLIT